MATTYNFEDLFNGLQQDMGDIYHRMSDLLTVGKDGPDDPFPGMTGWDVLYGNGTREAMKKLKEASMWIDHERMSVG